ncbi:o-methyltransferase [Hirsutella rhossiliensis]|uniref:O-methyltransferase domain-containing protein n=1 Tax=Hirsutella rhossiliensis TaxID=111463 RepID=A0A9P8SDV3_9HYPO|nr:o-methyltransferase domain-containing protein [Hirsutella rhossiliensis]KAH0957725.1 o-methyltransferase domain-containing protein [Hirsutella rhossiliensis]
MKHTSISTIYATAELAEKSSNYCEAHSLALPRHITDYHASVWARRDDSLMMSSNQQSQLHIFLARAFGVKRVIDVGVFVGYSAMVWSHAVGPDGLVTGLEISPEFAREAGEAFAANGINNIETIVGDASETLPKLASDTPYDAVFLDADKPGYGGYMEQLLDGSQPGAARRLLRPGALIVADNVLRWGHIPAPGLTTSYWTSEELKQRELEGLRRFNDRCAAEPRLEVVMLPVWDGVSLMRLLD